MDEHKPRYIIIPIIVVLLLAYKGLESMINSFTNVKAEENYPLEYFNVVQENIRSCSVSLSQFRNSVEKFSLTGLDYMSNQEIQQYIESNIELRSAFYLCDNLSFKESIIGSQDEEYQDIWREEIAKPDYLKYMDTINAIYQLEDAAKLIHGLCYYSYEIPEIKVKCIEAIESYTVLITEVERIVQLQIENLKNKVQ
jgi:hypothetical protein